jgi:hypothetical protein
MHQFTTSFSSLAKPLSPADSNEMSLHNAARKVGLTFDCKITYLEIPICTGYDDDGLPIVEMKGWPFLLPSDMEPWVYSIFFAYPLAYHFFITKKYIYIYEFLHLHWPGSKNAIESPSLFLGSATLCLRPKLSWMKGTWKRLWAWRKLGGTGETCCLTTRGILHLWTLSIQFQLPCMAPQLNPRKTRKPFE